MALIEILITTVGISLAKSLVKIWLKDAPIVEEIAVDLVDLLKTKSSDVIATRKGARIFEGLGDQVARNLEPIFLSYEGLAEVDTKGVRKFSREAVAFELTKAIDQSKLNAKKLALLNNDPVKLHNYIKEENPHGTVGLNEAEAALYDRSLDLISHYIIDLSSNLPDYSTRNFSEILNRLDLTDAKLTQIIQDLNILRAASDTSKGIQYANFESDYRANAFRRLDRVELLGINVQKSRRRYPLSIAYVALDVDIIHERKAHKERAVTIDDDLDVDQDTVLKTTERLPVEAALKNVKRVAIIGEAGSGKTTLLKWLAVNSATDKFSVSMLNWGGSIPFFIELRRFQELLPVPEQLMEKLVMELANEPPKGWISQILKAGKALILLDGIDEVTENRREEVIDWIEDLIKVYPNNHIVVTSRPAGFNANWLKRLDFNDFSLAPMEISAIELFVKYWHRAVLLEFGLEKEDQVEVFIEKLIFKLRNSLPLMRLATNPLLCAMICALHYDRQMHLPSDRSEIYEACCYMLLERRDIEREVQLEQYPKLTYKQKRVIVDDLAYWMMKNGYSSVSTSKATDRIKVRIANMQLPIEYEPKAILRMLIDRSGIVRQPNVFSIDFIHRTFQEYMSASAASSEEDWGFIISNASNDQWREMIVLSCGFANRKQADDLIQGILSINTSSDALKLYLDLLAISCLETSTEISPIIRVKVEERLHSIIPPKGQEQIHSLSSAGDIAASLLGFNSNYSEDEATACVQTLAMIGTRTAISQISTFAGDKRNKVTSAIENAMSYYTEEEIYDSGLAYAMINNLGDSIHQKRFHLKGNMIRALSRVPIMHWKSQFAGKVSHLILDEVIIYPFQVLDAFIDIEELTIIGSYYPTLEPICQFKGLKILDLRRVEDDWPDYMPSHLVRSLQRLKLQCYSTLFDLQNLRIFPNLNSLEIMCFDPEDVPDLTGMEYLKKLTYLHIANPFFLWPYLDFLEDLPQLKTMVISTEGESLYPLPGLVDSEGLENLIFNFDMLPEGLDTFLEELDMALPYGCKVNVIKGWNRNHWGISNN